MRYKINTKRQRNTTKIHKAMKRHKITIKTETNHQENHKENTTDTRKDAT